MEKKIVKYLTKEKVIRLEQTMSFLSNYTGPEEGTINQIGSSSKIEDRDEEDTKMLIRLGELNKEREEILSYFK